jgi:hypothetical protein
MNVLNVKQKCNKSYTSHSLTLHFLSQIPESFNDVEVILRTSIIFIVISIINGDNSKFKGRK